MHVDPALTVLQSNPANCATNNTCSNFVPPTAPCLNAPDVSPNAFCTTAQVGFSDKGLCRTGIAAANRIGVETPGGNSQQAAVIFVSHGQSGFGSFVAASTGFLVNNENGLRVPFPAAETACKITGGTATAGYAACNADGDNLFVNAPPVSGGSDPYDDLLAYADRNTLVSMFGNGSCQTVW